MTTEVLQFSAQCAAQVSKNAGTNWVLLVFTGHLQGEIPKELGELKQGKKYRITIEEED